MTRGSSEWTIETVLSDPLVVEVISADGVNPKELSILLYGVARIINARGCVSMAAMPSSPPAYPKTRRPNI
jgi:hypothetical protein